MEFDCISSWSLPLFLLKSTRICFWPVLTSIHDILTLSSVLFFFHKLCTTAAKRNPPAHKPCAGAVQYNIKKEDIYILPRAHLPTLLACTYQILTDLSTLALYPAQPQHTITQSLWDEVNKWRKWPTVLDRNSQRSKRQRPRTKQHRLNRQRAEITQYQNDTGPNRSGSLYCGWPP